MVVVYVTCGTAVPVGENMLSVEVLRRRLRVCTSSSSSVFKPPSNTIYHIKHSTVV